MPDEYAITLNAVSFQYRRTEHKALDNVDLRVRPGSFIGIVGRNRAGKSTLVSTINRIVPKLFSGDFEGAVSVFGEDIGDRDVAEMTRRVGMVFQDFETQLFSTSVRLEAAYVMENLGMPRKHMETQTAYWLDTLGLSAYADCEPTELSGGRKQRLALASVLAADPDILILDEPTTDLDPVSARDLMEFLKKHTRKGRTIICVTHDLESLAEADEIHIMSGGRIVVSGPPEKIIGDANILKKHGLRAPQIVDLFSRLEIETPCFNPTKAYNILKHRGYRATADTPMPSDEPIQENILCAANDIEFGYRAGVKVLKGINFNVRPGEFVAILGQNGSGKTTLLRHLAGIEKPWTGSASVAGEESSVIPPAKLATKIGMIFQNPDHQIFCQTCLEEVAFGLKNIQAPEDQIDARALEALRVVGLEECADDDPFAMTKGDRKKLAVASVLACKPQILLLDEPTTGLDAVEQQALMDMIQRLLRKDHAVIFVTHCMDLAVQYADRFVLMADGEIVLDGDLSDLVENADALKKADLLLPSATALGKMMGCVADSPARLAEFLTKDN